MQILELSRRRTQSRTVRASRTSQSGKERDLSGRCMNHPHSAIGISESDPLFRMNRHGTISAMFAQSPSGKISTVLSFVSLVLLGVVMKQPRPKSLTCNPIIIWAGGGHFWKVHESSVIRTHQVLIQLITRNVSPIFRATSNLTLSAVVCRIATFSVSRM